MTRIPPLDPSSRRSPVTPPPSLRPVLLHLIYRCQVILSPSARERSFSPWSDARNARGRSLGGSLQQYCGHGNAAILWPRQCSDLAATTTQRSCGHDNAIPRLRGGCPRVAPFSFRANRRGPAAPLPARLGGIGFPEGRIPPIRDDSSSLVVADARRHGNRRRPQSVSWRHRRRAGTGARVLALSFCWLRSAATRRHGHQRHGPCLFVRCGWHRCGCGTRDYWPRTPPATNSSRASPAVL